MSTQHAHVLVTITIINYLRFAGSQTRHCKHYSLKSLTILITAYRAMKISANIFYSLLFMRIMMVAHALTG